MRTCQMPSLTAIVIKNDSVVWSKAYGYSHLYLRKKASLDTIYMLGSISKTVTATAIMQLYEKGLLRLDDNISEYLSYDIKNPNHPKINITFRMLLAHQSSIGENYMNLIFSYPYPDDADEWIKENLLPNGRKYKKSYWKDYAPGENINYSSVGYMLLGLLVEKISNQSIEEYCRENIFVPLEMENTSVRIAYFNGKNLAKPYFPLVGNIYLPLFNYDLNCAAAFGGLHTNIEDISHFLIAQMKNGTYKGVNILNKSTVDLMQTVQYPDFKETFFGFDLQQCLGWMKMNISNELYGGYNGGSFGYMCNMMIRYSDNTGVVFLANGHFKRFPEYFRLKRANNFFDLGKLLLDKAG